MSKAKVILILAGIVVLSGCLGKSNYEKELMGKVWTEESNGNTFEYTFPSESSMKVLINDEKEWDYNISKVLDEERKFIVFAEKSGKYKQVFWRIKDSTTVELSQLVGGEYYENEADAASAAMDTKWMPLTKK